MEDPAVTRWPLKSLTIGPLVQKDHRWYERALVVSPNLPHLESVNLLGCYKRPFGLSRGALGALDQLLSREDIFPRLKRVDICITVGSQRPQYIKRYRVGGCLHRLRRAGKLYFWGEKREFVIQLKDSMLILSKSSDTPHIGRMKIHAISGVACVQRL